MGPHGATREERANNKGPLSPLPPSFTTCPPPPPTSILTHPDAGICLTLECKINYYMYLLFSHLFLPGEGEGSRKPASSSLAPSSHPQAFTEPHLSAGEKAEVEEAAWESSWETMCTHSKEINNPIFSLFPSSPSSSPFFPC